MGLKPEEAIAFEDSPSGMAAAAAAGLATFGVLTTQPAEKLMARRRDARPPWARLSTDDGRPMAAS